ncbi:hypothetical protein [Spirosoma pollinicola]|uniref:Uncharacterized protein n=1 Tax=Spirosoma pollinicola TaxID=2057025 RepID=A0A2K8ZAU8_9BACT|nr:hypothetical protein [Spirosoma pollinicola]AUD07006.1 hypothetical protein CWM47_37415 [Spirosoma pollinicola]
MADLETKGSDAQGAAPIIAKDSGSATPTPALQAMQTAYNGLKVPGVGKDSLSVNQGRIDESGRYVWTLTGKKSAIDSALQYFRDATSVTDALGNPAGVFIHSTIIDAQDGPQTEKAQDQTKTATITHLITTV